MARSNSTLATVFALFMGAGAACTPPEEPGTGGTGGSTSGTGGRPAGTGGTAPAGTGGTVSGTGGSGTGGTASGTGGTVSGTGGSGTGGSGTGGASSGTGGSGAEVGAETGGGDAPTGGKLVLNVEGFTMMGMRNCYPPASSGMGDKSPAMNWGPVPAGTKSWVLSVEDKSDMGPHQVVCHIPLDVVSRPADVKAEVPPGAEKGTRHGKPMDRWYGPGAGNVRQYEIRVWAIPTDKLPVSCAGPAGARAAFTYLKNNMNDKTKVLDTDGKSFWGNAQGRCM